MTQGDWIKKARKDAKVTLDELAAVIGTSKQAVFKYENNIVTNIPIDKVKLMANYLNVTPQELLGWETPPQKTPAQMDERTKEIMELVPKLSPQYKDLILAHIKGILAMQENHPTPDR